MPLCKLEFRDDYPASTALGVYSSLAPRRGRLTNQPGILHGSLYDGRGWALTLPPKDVVHYEALVVAAVPYQQLTGEITWCLGEIMRERGYVERPGVRAFVSEWLRRYRNNRNFRQTCYYKTRRVINAIRDARRTHDDLEYEAAEVTSRRANEMINSAYRAMDNIRRQAWADTSTRLPCDRFGFNQRPAYDAFFAWYVRELGLSEIPGQYRLPPEPEAPVAPVVTPVPAEGLCAYDALMTPTPRVTTRTRRPRPRTATPRVADPIVDPWIDPHAGAFVPMPDTPTPEPTWRIVDEPIFTYRPLDASVYNTWSNNNIFTNPEPSPEVPGAAPTTNPEPGPHEPQE